MNDSSTLVTPAEQPMTWSGWGDPTLRPGLSPRAEAHLARWIGPLERHTPPVALEDVRTSPSRLDDTTRAALTAIVGDGPYVHGDQIRSIDAVVYAYVVNLTEFRIDTPMTEAARAHANLVAYARRITETYFPELS